MRNIFSHAALAAILIVVASCAKEREYSKNGDEVSYFNSWVHINYPDIKEEESGIYILEDKVGTGEKVEDNDYLFVKYTSTDLEGNITATTDIDVAKKIGTYKEANYYGPQVLSFGKGDNFVGIESMLKDMRVNGIKKAIIPKWLITYETQNSLEEYKEHVSSGNNSIYTIELLGKTASIEDWELDSLERFSDKYLSGLDSLSKGFYYHQIKKPTIAEDFPKDTTIYINYIGRLLNGQVFDTTIADTAKFYNIWNSSRDYEPVSINWEESHDELTMGSSSSSLVGGFTKTLWEMQPFERGVGVFYSSLGYGTTGNGSTIPSYSPLLFDIEIVEKPE